MKRSGHANVAHSIRQPLLNLARQLKEEYSVILVCYYAAERWFLNAPFGLGRMLTEVQTFRGISHTPGQGHRRCRGGATPP